MMTIILIKKIFFVIIEIIRIGDKMKKLGIILFSICLLFVTGCEEKIKEIKMLKEVETINVGSKKSVKLSNKGNYQVVYQSSDSTVASVDSNGEITALKEGTAVISASVAEGNQLVNMTVRVNEVAKKVDSISLGDLDESQIPAITTPKLGVYVDQTKQIKSVVLPEDAENKELYWKSRNPSVATVTQEGKVTGVKAGNVVIVAFAKDGSGKKGLIEINVTKRPKK